MVEMVFDPKRLQRIRLQRRMSREKVALAAYCSTDAYRQWELGEALPSTYWQARLAKALGCAVEDFAKGWEVTEDA